MQPTESDNEVLNLVRKALSIDSATGTSISPFVKQDFEDEAYLQLYSESDPAQMALLKDLPRQPAQQVNHEFALVDRYGSHYANTSFAANGLPSSANIEGQRRFVQLKLHGLTSSVQGLTVLQNTIRAMGQPDIAASNDVAVKLLLQYLVNTEMYRADTRQSLDENRFKGCWQLIDELTRTGASVGQFANGDIFVDMRGQPLLPDGPKGIRAQGVAFNKRNATLRRIYMAPESLEVLENNLDPAARFMIPPQASNDKMIIGNSIDGMRVQGQIVYFRRDNALSSLVRTGAPNSTLIPGAPSAFVFSGSASAGNVSQPAVNNSGVGKFATTGERLTGIQYILVACNQVGDSIGSALSATVTATAGKTVEFTIYPRGNETSFKIYRGYSADAAQPGTFMQPVYRAPQFIAEIPNGASLGNTTPIVFVDSDSYIPGTVWAWGSDITSPNAAGIDRGEGPVSATNEYTLGKSAVAIAQLTGLFEFDLAKLGWLYSNKLFAHVLAPMVPRPWANVVWMNCAPAGEIKAPLLDGSQYRQGANVAIFGSGSP